tara:strand:+ start:966 stop:1211 length:246 start_codon:yes stop_codon:yes gene_type:complete
LNKLILLTGKDCPLCDKAKSLFADIDIGQLKLEELDIYSKRLYLDKYWDKIPVVLLQEKELFWPFESKDILEILDRNIKEI